MFTKQEGLLWWLLWFRASSPTRDAAGGQARSPSPLAVNGLFVQAQVLLGVCPTNQEEKRRESAFLKDTFICPLKTGQFV